jgi:hypothetical protein
MYRILQCCIVVVLIVSAGGCSPTITKVQLSAERYPARPSNFPIQLYAEKFPECEYEEIGVVSSQQIGFVSVEETTEGLRKAAREMGGDAIVNFRMGQITQTDVSGNSKSVTSSTSTSAVLNGTVIRFKQENCRK